MREISINVISLKLFALINISCVQVGNSSLKQDQQKNSQNLSDRMKNGDKHSLQVYRKKKVSENLLWLREYITNVTHSDNT